MKRTIILFIWVILTVGLAAIGCAPTPEPQNPAEIGMTMAAQAMDAQATKMRIDIQYTATAQIIAATQNVQNTQAAAAVTEQYRMDAIATDQQNRRDAAATAQRIRDDAATQQARLDTEATAEQGRRDAEATAEQGRVDTINTQSADATATWVPMTLTAAPTSDWLTQQNAMLELEEKQNNVDLSDLEVEQQQEKNTLEWLIPFLISLALTALISVVAVRRSRVREVRNDETGVIEALILDNAEVLRPQLMPGPVLNLSGGSATAPQVTDKETQNEVTRRAQAIEALRAMPTQAPNANAALMANNVFGEARKPVVEIVDAEAVSGWLEDVTRQADEMEA
jgi:hypothetical protein